MAIKPFSYTDEVTVFSIDDLYKYALYGDWPTQPLYATPVSLSPQLPINTIRVGTDGFSGVDG